jgi:hypothetical protein
MTRDDVARLRMLLHAMVDNLAQDEKERAA